MEYVEVVIALLSLAVFASIVQGRLKIPLPVTLFGTMIGLSFLSFDIVSISDTQFDNIVYSLLPLLILSDVLHLKFESIKENWFSIFITAIIAVLLSVGLGIWLKDFILPEHNISIISMMMLLPAVIATDPVSVSSVSSSFKIPKRLKVLAEGESLVNDASAFVVFFIALTLYKSGGVLTYMEIATLSSIMVLGAVVVGFIVGAIGMYLLKLSNDPVVEAAILLIIAYLAFYIAEHWHLAGILSIVISMFMVNSFITHRVDELKKNIHEEEEKISNEVQYLNGRVKGRGLRSFLKLEHLIKTYDNHEQIVKYISFISLLAVIVLFISISDMINFINLQMYWKEILYVFLATTIIRGIMMAKFMFISNSFENINNIPIDWWAFLTFAGVKGGLSILMIHLIPESHPNKELFTSIVIGVILLSTFIYSIILMVLLKYRQKNIMSFE